MKWYFGFDERASKWFSDMLRVAVASAATHAPQLEPHCLFDGDGDTDLTRWLVARGVTLHRAVTPVRDRLTAPDILARNVGTGYDPVSARGYFLCLAVPAIAPDTDEHVFFTDCDVMFTGPVDVSGIRPSLLAAAPEMLDVRRPAPGNGRAGFNSGVMVMNVAAMRARMPTIRSVLERDAYYPTNGAYDQGALNSAVPYGDWDRLPDTLNWRPPFGIRPDASIIHWHGPKPRHVQKTLTEGVMSAPDEAMRAMLSADLEAYRHYLELFRAVLSQT